MSVSGTWKNAYGSTMSLNVYGSGLVLGQYRSSTGSTGTYAVIGAQGPADPSAAAGQPVALAIDWHSIVAGPPDNSWHWASGLSGQLSLSPTGGGPSLVLAHAMVATATLAFPGGAIDPGTYIDKLVYAPVAAAAPAGAGETPGEGDPIASPLNGRWQGSDGSVLTLAVSSAYSGAFGWVLGTYQVDGGVWDVGGVTDINAYGAGVPRESVALTLVDGAGNAIALAGTLQLQTMMLNLSRLTSVATLPSVTYAQTRIDDVRFTPG
jgi:saccharopepsin